MDVSFSSNVSTCCCFCEISISSGVIISQNGSFNSTILNGFVVDVVQGKKFCHGLVEIHYLLSSQNPSPLQVCMDSWLQQSTIRSHLLLWMFLVLFWGTSIHPDTITLDTEWLVIVHNLSSLFILGTRFCHMAGLIRRDSINFGRRIPTY